VPLAAALGLDNDAAEDERPALAQTVRVVSDADAKHKFKVQSSKFKVRQVGF
jgi:hypothetical protein